MMQKLLWTVMITMMLTTVATAGEFTAHWRSCAPAAPGETECIELEFLPNGVFKSGGRHANGWITYETGVFHYNEATGELFVYVENAGLEWPMPSPNAAEPLLYQAEVYAGYQRYFKIVFQDADLVTVEEYRNSYRDASAPMLADLYDNTPVWAGAGIHCGLIRPLDLERLATVKYYVINPL